MPKKILFGIIGALIALLLLILGVIIGTNAIGFQAVAVIELGLNIIVTFLLSKKFAPAPGYTKATPSHPNHEMLHSLSLGALYGSIAYLALIFIAKTVVFSLLSGIVN